MVVILFSKLNLPNFPNITRKLRTKPLSCRRFMELGSSSSFRLQRNIKERHRRMHMNDLLSRLRSLVHPQASRFSKPELLDQATFYVKQLKGSIEELKRRKGLMSEGYNINNTNNKISSCNSSRAPVLNITSCDSTLEVTLITALKKKVMLHELVRVLQEGGAEIRSYTYQTAGDCVMYTIISQAISLRIGIDTSRIDERLKALVQELSHHSG